MRTVIRLIRSIAIALSVLQPTSRASLPTSQSVDGEFTPSDEGVESVAAARHDYSYLHRQYKGPVTPITEPYGMTVASGARMIPVTTGRLRNRTVTVTDPEVEKFVADRSS